MTDPAWQAAVRDGCTNADIWEHEAEAFLRAFLATLERHGYVLVPKVATAEMEQAAYEAAGCPGDSWFGYQEMHAAAVSARPSVVPEGDG